ncbi:Relaxin-3 [Liparis tanakae]|uniref:Relaxin-3 n=1 Tax=Liparis tanakae TaxID=230148 RepID=A0A4Z2IUL5_9TELE|nr:Relaxin-3 [Liparis tanakae]
MLCMSCVAQVQTEHNKNTLRLCGRSFVRAVVYTCGGSRWRRMMGGTEALQAGSREPKLKTTDEPAIDRQRRDQNKALISVCWSDMAASPYSLDATLSLHNDDNNLNIFTLSVLVRSPLQLTARFRGVDWIPSVDT